MTEDCDEGNARLARDKQRGQAYYQHAEQLAGLFRSQVEWAG